MRGSPSTRQKQVSVVVAAAALGLDALIALAAILTEPGGAALSLGGLAAQAMSTGPLIAHTVLVLAMTAMYLGWRRGFEFTPAVPLLLVLMAFMGPLGTVVGSAAAFMGALLPAREADSGEEQANDEGAESDRVGGGLRLEPGPLADVFRRGTLAQRRNAVALIGANFRPEFAEALRMALRDENNAIRVQAGLVMQRLEDDFDQRQAKLKAHVDNATAQQAADTSDAWLELARLHDQHAYTGLLDEERTRRAHAEALRAYRHHLSRHPDDVAVIAAVGRLLVRAGQHIVVADWLQVQIAAGRVSASILMWYAEALYRAGRFRVLQEVAARHGEQILRELPTDSPFRGAFKLWGAGRPTADPVAAPDTAAPTEDAHGAGH